MTGNPQRMSFFWDGPMSWLRYMTLHSFRRLNPGWEMRLYSCPTSRSRTWRSIERMDCERPGGEDYSHLVDRLGVQVRSIELPLSDLSPAHASDLFSYRYLGTDGGWYADMDILWVRPMDRLPPEVYAADVVLCRSEGVYAVGFLAGGPGCTFWQEAYRTALGNYTPGGYQSCGAEVLHHLARFRLPELDLRVAELPTATVYPFWPTAGGMDQLLRQTVGIPPECIGIHWFGGHPDSQMWSKRLNAENYGRPENRNTLTDHIMGVTA